MKDLLKELTLVSPGDSLMKIVTARRVNALQDAVRELAGRSGAEGGDPLRKGLARGHRVPRFMVWFSGEHQRLYVTEGSVAVANERTPDTPVRPAHPTLEGTPLRDNPYFDVGGKDPGAEYEVICIYESLGGKARVVLHKKEDELEVNGCERARVIATLTFKEGENGLALDSFRQDWASDIERTIDEVSCQSDSRGDGSGGDGSGGDGSGGDGSGGDGSGGDGSGGDGSDDDGSGDDDDDGGGSGSDDSDDSDNSSDSHCCPRITLNEILVDTGDPAGCFPVTGPGGVRTAHILVSGHVGAIPCEECRGRLWVEFGIGQGKASAFLGLNGGQDFAEVFEVLVVPCSELTAWACVRVFGGGGPIGSGCQVQDCCVEGKVRLPGPCPDGECGSDSSTSSSSSSGSSGSSGDGGGSGSGSEPGGDGDGSGGGDSGSGGDDSGSGGSDSGSGGSDSGSGEDDSDGGSDKNCIVPLGGGYRALACVESPETWFLDYMSVSLRGRETRAAVDPLFAEACEPGTLRVVGAVPDRPGFCTAAMEGDAVVVRTAGWLRRPQAATVTVAGIRKGSTERFPARSGEQYEKSRRFWSELNR